MTNLFIYLLNYVLFILEYSVRSQNPDRSSKEVENWYR